MSTPVQSSLADLKASTAQLVGIIAGARHIPAGTVDVHLALTKQVTTLLGDIIRAHEKGDYIPGIVASCSKELMMVRSRTPRVLPDWHSIGHDDPRVSRHTWRKQVCAWEALGDNSCDLPVVPNPSTGPLTVNLPSPPVPSPTPVLPSPPIVAGNVAGSSGKMTSEFRDKGKGKAVAVDLEPEVRGSSKRKSPMISGHSSQPLKSAMKSCKRVKSTRLTKSKLFVESEDDEETIVQPISRGVPEVVLPQLSTIVVRTPQLPRSPGSPKKQSFGPASLTVGSRPEKSPISCPEAWATSGSRPEVDESSDDTSSTSDGEPPSNPTFDITIPGPNNPCHYCIKEDWPCATHLDKRSGHPCLSCIRCSTKKIKCNPASLGSPPKHTLGKSTTSRTHSKTPALAPSNALSPSHKTITAKKTPAPAPASAPASVPSLSFALPRAALDVPMPDLHSMAITIRDGAAHITILEAHVLEQDVMEPTPLMVEDGSAMVGLMVEPTQVQPEGPQSSGEIVVLDEPGNLLPEYDSSDEEIDVEVKVDRPAEEVEMAT
ncbi:uncharacterized protein F5147DRAFT_780726 [Suillus discolor]|uniref:Uncharacterized protein n=1 Tax=Suillus discolor TaxID=1912936 RepID=A0A9P7JMB3_9AGAM|nr:uncharacterized protein F5147DRAFT_780726 [Suillus discolor]KAG2089129.1 hypothetical protein F5147DRAFT_780726 [Suillus discolor]